MQSQMVTEKAWGEVMKEYESIYQNINRKVSGEEVKEPVLFSLPPDYKNPPSKPEEVNTITDIIVKNTIKESPLEKVDSTDRIYTRKALGEKDFKEIEQFERNMKTLPPDKMVEHFTTEYLCYPKSVKEMNIAEIIDSLKIWILDLVVKDCHHGYGGQIQELLMKLCGIKKKLSIMQVII